MSSSVKNLSFQKNLFRQSFPNYLSEELENLDSKHLNVARKLTEQVDWLESLSLDNFRQWGGQDDLGVPVNFSYFMTLPFSLGKRLIKFAYSLIKYREISKQLKFAMQDDIQIIKSIGGEDLLLSNPVHLTPGKPTFVKHEKTTINSRWLRYIYLSARIRASRLIPENGVWVDIGSYYGGLQSIVAKSDKPMKIILIDFHHQLFRSFAFLSEQFPQSLHDLGGEMLTNDNNGLISFHYLHVSQYEKLDKLRIDLLSNFFSLGEMRREVFANYISSSAFQKAKSIYAVNRFVSSPFFEQTYDNDLTILDYCFPNHEVNYFDIFPIHYFGLYVRELLGNKRARSISSPYFEAIWNRSN